MAEDVLKSVVWSALGVSLTMNRLMNNLPSLLAQEFISLQTHREETYRENHRQQILKQFKESSRQEEKEHDEGHRRTFHLMKRRN